MNVIQSAEKAWGNLSIRLLTLVVGVGLVVGLLSLYPQSLSMIEWAIPLGLIFWGVSRFYLHGVGDSLTSTVGCLLILGGVTLALYQLIPMGELTGTVAHLIPTTGIFVELFAVHYRDE